MAQAYFAEEDWYTTPLLYDIVFAADTPLEATFLATMQERYGKTRGKQVLEPACGSGRLVEEMARRGYSVTGFDQSDEMLQFARTRLREHKLRARLNVGQMENFAYNTSFDLAHCLVSTFKYLLHETHAQQHLACVAQALKPGGLYVLGFHLSDYDDPRRSRERWSGERHGTRVVCNIQSWPADRRSRRERIRSRMVVYEGKKQRKMETNWLFRTYDVAQFKRLLRKVPQLEHVATYDFTYNEARPRAFDDQQLDCVLILRKIMSA